MRERSQVLAGPIGVAGPSVLGHLGALVAADVLARRAAAEGRLLPAATAVLAGGLSDQYAAEEDLVREGLDKAVLGRRAFSVRAEELEDQARGRLAAVVAHLGLDVDVERAGAAGKQAARAASTAFVRLFDAGMVVEAERVVDVCPRCATVATGTDAMGVELEGEALVVRLGLFDGPDPGGHVEVRCLAPELLPGTVAVAVPEGHPAAGHGAAVPVAATVVPVVPDPSVDAPTLVVPAHDADALEIARRCGASAVPVVDAYGTVRAPGPLEGLARYAARAAARRLLAAEGALAGAAPTREPAARCAACRTVLVPVLGRHWFLAMGDLEVAAADALREGRLVVSPPSARDELFALAGTSAEWCLSRQVWAGHDLPVARCADCGQVEVSVETATSCRRCMGDLVPQDGVLDARFVRCVWPLSVSGWPDGGRGPGQAAATTLLMAPADRLADVLAMAALGLRLSGEVPFGEVAMTPAVAEAATDGPARPVDLGALVARDGRRALRVALLCGELDLEAARDVVARLDAMPVGQVDVAVLERSCAEAFDAAAPASALGLLAAALAEGVPGSAAGRVLALAAPFVGG